MTYKNESVETTAQSCGGRNYCQFVVIVKMCAITLTVGSGVTRGDKGGVCGCPVH